MPDFSTILNKPTDSITKPKAIPAGTYHGMATAHELGESMKQKTPFVRYLLRLTAADASIAPELLEGVDITKKQLRKDFFLTEDAQYRLIEAIESCGVQKTGMSLGQIIPQLCNRPLMIEVTQRLSEDGQETYNDVKTIRGAA